MIFSYRVKIKKDFIVLTDEITSLEIHILYRDIEDVRTLLLDAKQEIEEQEATTQNLEQLELFLTGAAKEFVQDLLRMGYVIPIQKQAIIAKNDA